MKKHPYIYDEESFFTWVEKRGLPESKKQTVITLTLRGTKEKALTEALRLRQKILLHINLGDIRLGKTRLETRDIRIIINLLLDFEYPQNPRKCLEIGREFLAELIRMGFACEGQDIDISGGGCHIILGIPPIYCENGDQAEEFNAAWLRILENEIEPIFNRICRNHNVVMKLDHCGIAQLVAPTGTIRYSNDKKPDCEDLKPFVLRKNDGGDGKRHESAMLQAKLLDYKNNPPKTTKQFKKEAFRLSEDILLDSEYQRYYSNGLRWYEKNNIREKVFEKLGRYSTSDEFCKVLGHFRAAYNLADVAIKAAIAARDIVGSDFTDDQAVEQAHLLFSRTTFHDYHFNPYHEVIQKPDQRKYSVSVDSEKSDEISQWISMYLRVSDGSIIPSRAVYDAYLMNSDFISDRLFFRVMKANGFETKTMRYGGEPTKCYVGIAFVLRVVKSITVVLDVAV